MDCLKKVHMRKLSARLNAFFHNIFHSRCEIFFLHTNTCHGNGYDAWHNSCRLLHSVDSHHVVCHVERVQLCQVSDGFELVNLVVGYPQLLQTLGRPFNALWKNTRAVLANVPIHGILFPQSTLNNCSYTWRDLMLFLPSESTFKFFSTWIMFEHAQYWNIDFRPRVGNPQHFCPPRFSQGCLDLRFEENENLESWTHLKKSKRTEID